jgi:hypothetical protein
MCMCVAVSVSVSVSLHLGPQHRLLKVAAVGQDHPEARWATGVLGVHLAGLQNLSAGGNQSRVAAASGTRVAVCTVAYSSGHIAVAQWQVAAPSGTRVAVCTVAYSSGHIAVAQWQVAAPSGTRVAVCCEDRRQCGSDKKDSVAVSSNNNIHRQWYNTGSGTTLAVAQQLVQHRQWHTTGSGTADA